MTYSDIIKRLEEATGPDRELDARIFCAANNMIWEIDGQRVVGIDRDDGNNWETIGYVDPGKYSLNFTTYREDIPTYTSSLDATIAIVERMLPGWRKAIGENVHTGYWQGRVYRLRDDDIFERYGCHGTSPQLAMLIAMFRALEAEGRS